MAARQLHPIADLGPSTRSLVVLLLGLVACAPGSPYPEPPPTAVRTVVDTLHGVAFADDYRWLEDQQAPETRAWIEAQNRHAEAVVGETPVREHFRTRLRELLDRDDVGTVRRAGDWEYFPMRRKGEEAASIYRRPAPTDSVDDPPEPSVDETYEVFLDPADLDPDYRTLVSLRAVSPDERLMMIQIREGGADEVEIRIRDLETGEDLPDGLPPALYGGIDWDPDSRGFTYTHRSRVDGPRIKHHALGTEPAEDEVLWGEGYAPTAFIGTDVYEDGRYRIFTAQHGWAWNELHLQDTPNGGEVRDLTDGIRAHVEHRWHDGRLWIRTDWEASNYRLLVLDPDAGSLHDAREVLPERAHLLRTYTFVDDRIYATYLEDVEDRVLVFEMDGTPAGEVEVPERSSVSVSEGDDDGTIGLDARGYLSPGVEYALDPQTGEREVTEPPDVPFDPGPYEVTKLTYTSGGGVSAPVYVMHRRGIELDGSHPTILNGYGGFNVAITPGFSATRAAWVEAGGVYAVATLRGGSEYGESWHRDGMLTNKQHVFDDFIAAAEALVEHGFTGPDRLGIQGGSNGGLLVASAMTQRPDLFRAVLCTYPDLDMVRFWAFGETNNKPALLEYGDARIPDHFEAIRRYSPYQAVGNGIAYPAVMLTTGDLDTRVPPLQARKMTARLQAATGSRRPVILWYDEKGGHAGGRGRPMSMRIEDGARELAFMAGQLGLSVEDGDGA